MDSKNNDPNTIGWYQSVKDYLFGSSTTPTPQNNSISENDAPSRVQQLKNYVLGQLDFVYQDAEVRVQKLVQQYIPTTSDYISLIGASVGAASGGFATIKLFHSHIIFDTTTAPSTVINSEDSNWISKQVSKALQSMKKTKKAVIVIANPQPLINTNHTSATNVGRKLGLFRIKPGFVRRFLFMSMVEVPTVLVVAMASASFGYISSPFLFAYSKKKWEQLHQTFQTQFKKEE